MSHTKSTHYQDTPGLPAQDVDVFELEKFASYIAANVSTARSVTAEQKSKIWAKISDGLANPAAPKLMAAAISTIPEAAGQWYRLNSEIQVKVLQDDGVMRSFLMRVDPGGRIPDHPHHHAEEECLVLEGEVWIGGELLRTGDYQHSAKGSMHRDLVSPKGCLLFLRGATNERY